MQPLSCLLVLRRCSAPAIAGNVRSIVAALVRPVLSPVLMRYDVQVVGSDDITNRHASCRGSWCALLHGPAAGAASCQSLCRHHTRQRFHIGPLGLHMATHVSSRTAMMCSPEHPEAPAAKLFFICMPYKRCRDSLTHI